jgi:hypothetical protein
LLLEGAAMLDQLLRPLLPPRRRTLRTDCITDNVATSIRFAPLHVRSGKVGAQQTKGDQAWPTRASTGCIAPVRRTRNAWRNHPVGDLVCGVITYADERPECPWLHKHSDRLGEMDTAMRRAPCPFCFGIYPPLYSPACAKSC